MRSSNANCSGTHGGVTPHAPVRRSFSEGGSRITNHVLLLLLVLWSAPALRAATKIWDGSSHGNWSTAANWSPSAPASGDDVVFPAGASNLTKTNNISGLRLRSVTFGGSNQTLRATCITIA